MIRFPKILFFVNDCVPSEEQMLEAQGYGNRCSFRNATMVPAPIFKEVKNDKGEVEKKLQNANFLEECDAVAGDVPALYEDFPSAEDVLADFEAQRKDLLAAAKKKAKDKAAALKEQKKLEAEAKAKLEAEEKAKEEEAAKLKEANEAAEAEAKAEQEKKAKESSQKDWEPNK